tara:strand:+ start:15281 stop:15559 length:279 start_codon:yes stop_codon:yes gene_type:complete
MSFKFNPLTGQLDLVNDEGSSTHYKKYTTADTGFLMNRKVTLDAEPKTDSELVFFNGLIIKDDCYSINSNELTFDGLLDIRLGDFIDIRYVA